MKLSRPASVALILTLLALPLPGWAKNKAAAKDATAETVDAAKAGEPGAKPDDQPVQMLIRSTDFQGATTVKVVSPQEYQEIKHEVDKDNAALPVAFNTLRKNWRKSQPTTQRQTVYIQGQRREIDVRIPVPPFPLKCPPPKEARLIGQFKDPAVLEAKKKELDDKEQARIARLEKEADKKDAALSGMKGGLKRPEPKQPKNKNASLEKDRAQLMADLITEVEKLRAGGDDKALKPAAGGRPIKRMGQ